MVVRKYFQGAVSAHRESGGTDRRWILYCFVIAFITVIAFLPALGNGFTNWDDDVYVTDNPLIHSLSIPSLLRIFSPGSFVFGNYQPITMVTYALNYAAGGLNPAGYILADLLVHLLNVLLVFIVIRKISRSDFVASLCALLFGIHPMHVEAVAWISGRKELLYTFFYLASLFLYVSYIDRGKRSAKLRYAGSIALFVCSLLSKSSAVTLPAVLFLIDYYRGRKFSARSCVEKLPFLVPAILIGFWAVKGQYGAGSLSGYGTVPFFSRIAVVCYSFVFYVVKFFVPLKLSALYPYPASFAVSRMPVRYLWSPLFAVGAAVAVWYFRRSKPFVFGFGFFLINVLFVLHFIPVGATVTTDRFSYCAYIGLSFIAAQYIERSIGRPRLDRIRVAAWTALFFVMLVFGYAVHERCKVWKNSETLWSDVIGKYPSPVAYNNLGYAYYADHDYAHALEVYNRVIMLHPSFADGHKNLALLYDALGDRPHAIEEYTRTIICNPAIAKAYNGRGIDYYENGDYDHAMNDFERAITLDSGFAEAYNNLGNVLKNRGDQDGAMADYSHAVQLNPQFADGWYNKACVYQAMNLPDRAVECFTRTVALDSGYAPAYSGRGLIYCTEGRFEPAIADFSRAITLQPASPEAYVNRGNACGSVGDFSRAISDFSRALSLFPAPEKYPQVFFNRGRAYAATGDLAHAGEDFMKACSLHFEYACRELENRGLKPAGILPELNK
jgi:tetratricopeptide (TPR) repeat protein